MNRGIIIKSLRETATTTFFFALGMGAFQWLLAVLIPTFQEGFTEVLQQLKFVQYILSALLGMEAEAIGPQALHAMPWAHPFVLALAWAHAIMFCTRLPAGETERGTIDVLLSFPIRRTTLFFSEVLVWAVSGGAIIAAGLIGNLIGTFWTAKPESVDVHSTLVLSVNLLFLYLAVGSLAWLLSSWSERRGRAIGAAFALVLCSFLINTLATFSAAFSKISFLGLMSYYRPVSVLTGGGWPVEHLVTLAAVSMLLLIVSAVTIARRDIRTV